MFDFRRTKSLVSAFRDDEGGNMALTFAISSVMVVGAMGAAMDFSTLKSAEKRSQSIADSTALSAAIFVKNNDRQPLTEEEGRVGGVDRYYSASELGYDYKGWVKGGSDAVSVKIIYDDHNKEARVTVKGETIPTFVQVLGKKDMKFETTSVVSYMQVEEMHPASITLVLDNSGSMRWDDKKLTFSSNGYGSSSGTRPDGVEPRIDGLKASVHSFRHDMLRRIGNQRAADGQRVLRTGILPYNDAVIPTADDSERRMKWAYNGIKQSVINEMYASGSTNSNPPMAMARIWLDKENNKHRSEANRTNGAYREPLKFVIFMTDGQNTSGNFEFVPDNSTNRYYAYINLGSGTKWYVSKGYPYNYHFKEGRLELDSDRRTIESCEAMHAEGTQIYTIGYGLDVGKYYDPLYPSDPGEVTEAAQATAYGLLTACASKPENFIKAADGVDLQSAFDQIQNAIVKELIRLKS